METVQSVVDGMGAQADVIEREKLKAIGQRCLAASEEEVRRRRAVRGAEAALEEKAAELARLEAEYASLLAVEQEQKETIAKLSNNEPAGLVL